MSKVLFTGHRSGAFKKQQDALGVYFQKARHGRTVTRSRLHKFTFFRGNDHQAVKHMVPIQVFYVREGSHQRLYCSLRSFFHNIGLVHTRIRDLYKHITGNLIRCG